MNEEMFQIMTNYEENLTTLPGFINNLLTALESCSTIRLECQNLQKFYS